MISLLSHRMDLVASRIKILRTYHNLLMTDGPINIFLFNGQSNRSKTPSHESFYHARLSCHAQRCHERRNLFSWSQNGCHGTSNVVFDCCPVSTRRSDEDVDATRVMSCHHFFERKNNSLQATSAGNVVSFLNSLPSFKYY